jgi:hypothetical protein
MAGDDSEGAAMKRIVEVVSAVGFAAMAASASISTPVQQPTFRVRTDVVSVPVAVMSGREPVLGLTAADFELTDNGVRQTVDAVSSDEVPIDVTLLLTEFPVGTTPEHVRSLLSAEATHKLLRPSDRVRLVIVDDRVSGRDVPVGYDLREDPVVRDLTWGTARANGFSCCGPESGGDDRWGFGVSLADGLFYTLAWPVASDRRHLVVAFTDGFDTASTLELDRLPKLAARSDAVLHAVFWATPSAGSQQAGGLAVSNPAALRPGWDASFRVVDATIRQTGGSIHRSSGAPTRLADIIANFRTSYILRYTPRGVDAKGWHELQVKVARRGSLSIRARKGYEGS